MRTPVPTDTIFGHHDILANQRDRILEAIASSDCVLLKIRFEALLLLTKEALYEFSKDCQEMNAIDVGYQYTLEHNLQKQHEDPRISKKPQPAKIVSKRTESAKTNIRASILMKKKEI